jgi:hypothetical protein
MESDRGPEKVTARRKPGESPERPASVRCLRAVSDPLNDRAILRRPTGRETTARTRVLVR